MVTARKCAMSDLSRHGRPPSRPITPLSAMAATRMMSGTPTPAGSTSIDLTPPLADIATAYTATCLHGDLRLDVRMRVIACERKVLIAKRENVGHGRVEMQARKRARRARELQARLLQMIEIEVRISKRMDEFARLITG